MALYLDEMMTPAELSKGEISNFHEKLFQWYKENRRNFSFRKTNNPFHILVSEMMLHKTGAIQVDRLFPEFIEKYPTPDKLAQAPVKEIERAVKPLGILRRARTLKQLAKTLVKNHEETVPRERELLESLPGVGRYTAGAVRTFAFEEAEPMVDTNVVRFLERFVGLKSKSSRPRDDEVYWETYANIRPDADRRDFHYALLDLGALICTSGEPRCEECPLNVFCLMGKKKTGKREAE